MNIEEFFFRKKRRTVGHIQSSFFSFCAYVPRWEFPLFGIFLLCFPICVCLRPLREYTAFLRFCSRFSEFCLMRVSCGGQYPLFPGLPVDFSGGLSQIVGSFWDILRGFLKTGVASRLRIPIAWLKPA